MKAKSKARAKATPAEESKKVGRSRLFLISATWLVRGAHGDSTGVIYEGEESKFRVMRRGKLRGIFGSLAMAVKALERIDRQEPIL